MFPSDRALMTNTPARFIDFACAPDAETAEKLVAKEHEISERSARS